MATIRWLIRQLGANWNECPKCGTAYDDPADARKCCGP